MLPSVLKTVKRLKLGEFKRFESSVLLAQKTSKFDLLSEALESNKVFDDVFRLMLIHRLPLIMAGAYCFLPCFKFLRNISNTTCN